MLTWLGLIGCIFAAALLLTLLPDKTSREDCAGERELK
jgi:hypothetical protein